MPTNLKFCRFFLTISLLSLVYTVKANASCSCSPNYTYIALEFTTDTCPPDGADDSTFYYYKIDVVSCVGGEIKYSTSYGDTYNSPQFISTFWSGNGYRVLRNDSGTHMLMVMPYYIGTINGINTSVLSTGVYTYPTMNQYCLGSSLQDSDGDNYPDCLDCAPNDPSTSLNCTDNCPDDPDKTEPDICGCGTPDTDGDGDSVPDCNDNCPADSNKTEPGDCGCGTPEADSDSDGTPDCIDECPNDPDHTDNDGDGTLNCNDNCPNDINKIEPGTCGCHAPETDTDGDTIPDCIDECPNDANNTDSDGDGTPDCIDNCPGDPEKSEPGVCGCNAPDIDSDDNGIYDCKDLDQDLNKGPQC